MNEYVFTLAKPGGFSILGLLDAGELEGHIEDYLRNRFRDDKRKEFIAEFNAKAPDDIIFFEENRSTRFRLSADTPEDARNRMKELSDLFFEVGKKYSRSEKADERYGRLRYIPSMTRLNPIFTN